MLAVPTKSVSVIIFSQITFMITSIMTKVTRVMMKKVRASLRENSILFRMFVLSYVVMLFTFSIFLSPLNIIILSSGKGTEYKLTFNIFIIKIIMNIGDKDFAASEYARARVEEIKRKVATSRASSRASSKENAVTPVSRENYDLESSKKPITEVKELGGLREAYNSKEIQEYKNRIQNIDCINMKIKGILDVPFRSKPTQQFKHLNLGYHAQDRNKVDLKQQNQPERRPSLADFAKSKQTVSIEYQKKPIYSSSTMQENRKYGPHLAELRPIDKYAFTNKTQGIEQQKTQRIEQQKCESNKTDKYDFSKSDKVKSPKLEKSELERLRQPKPVQSSNKKQEKSNIPQTKTVSRKEEEPSAGSKEITHLAETLSQQITLDQKFRQAKCVFSEWRNPQKWDILIQKYQLRYKGSSIEEVKQVFSASSEEHNPFFQSPPSIDETCIDELLDTYKQALDSWQIKVDECANIKKLEKEFFSVKDIDLNRKGFISVEDIVCFVNLYTGNFFRNRDVISLYKRFTKTGELSYESFLDKVTK